MAMVGKSLRQLTREQVACTWALEHEWIILRFLVLCNVWAQPSPVPWGQQGRCTRCSPQELRRAEPAACSSPVPWPLRDTAPSFPVATLVATLVDAVTATPQPDPTATRWPQPPAWSSP